MKSKYKLPILNVVQYIKCYQWLTLQVVLYCRTFYAALENRTAQVAWLHTTLDKMLTSGKGALFYSIDNMGTGAQRCCARAWRFAYGVAHSTLKRHLLRNRDAAKPLSNKKAKSMRGMSRRMFLIVWLK
jgi:hypothetical protein